MLTALLRFGAYWLLRPFVQERAYAHADQIPGYAGYVKVKGHCLAFRRDDGRLQFRW